MLSVSDASIHLLTTLFATMLSFDISAWEHFEHSEGCHDIIMLQFLSWPAEL